MQTKNSEIINTSRDAIRGYVAVTSCAAGWPALLSVHMGRIAETAASARLIEGVEAEEAIAQSISEVELLAAMDVFATRIAKGASPEDAFAAVAEVKRKAMGDEPHFKAIMGSAEDAFRTALIDGLTPYSALIAADIAASAAQRLIAKSEKNVN